MIRMQVVTIMRGPIVENMSANCTRDFRDVVYKDINNGDSGHPQILSPKGIGVRHLQVAILFLSFTSLFLTRSHISVSLVAMINATVPESQISTQNDTNWSLVNVNVKDEAESQNNHNDSYIININRNLYNKSTLQEYSKWTVYSTYNWDKGIQEMILFSFYLGYSVMNFPMGLIVQKLGGKLPIMLALLINGIISILTPWVPIFGGWIAVCVCRVLQGVTQAALYPSLQTLLSKWSPVSERGRLGSYLYGGGVLRYVSYAWLGSAINVADPVPFETTDSPSYASQFGTTLAFQLSGLLAGNPTIGWPANFWTFGSLSLVSFVILAIFGAASPHEHSNISKEEMAFIVGSTAENAPKKRKIPWRHILTSSAVWGCFASQIGSAIGYLFVISEIPVYMNKVLNINLKNSALLSSMPYISMCFANVLFGTLTDYFLNKKLISVINIRRISNTIGMAVSTLFLLAFSFTDNTVIAVILLILSVTTHSGVHTGYTINQIDISPNYTGIIMSIGNAMSTFLVLILPVIVTSIVKNDVTNKQKWQIVFGIVAVIQIVTNFIFVYFIKGDIQPWNYYGQEKTEDFQKLKQTKPSESEKKNENN